MNELTHSSLCTGIGGFDEAAEIVGFKNVSNCEIDNKCRTYLKQRFPNAKQYTNVITDPPKEQTTVLSFGFPCQDISTAGKGVGIFGERSKLFFNCMDVVRKNRPKYFVAENSTNLLNTGMGFVLSEIHRSGYNAEWICLSGSQFGFPQMRKRLFIVAHTMCKGLQHSILQSPGAFKLSKTWTPGETFIHVSACRANGFRDIKTISRGNVVPNNNFWLHSIGNAVMPICAEHIFRCIKYQIENE